VQNPPTQTLQTHALSLFLDRLLCCSADVSIVGATNRAATSSLGKDSPVWENQVDLKKGKFGTPRVFVMGVYNRRRLQQTKRQLLSWLTW
jgi:hypothetical protein